MWKDRKTISMESEMNYTEDKQINSSQNNSGKSAPSSVLANWDIEENNKKNDWLTSSFNTVQDLEERKKSEYNNVLNSEWSSQYPTTSKNIKTSCLNDGYRAQKSVGTGGLSCFSAQNAGYGFSSSLSSNTRQVVQMEIPPAMPSTLGMLPKISEVENETEEMINTIHDQKFVDTQYYSCSLPFSSLNHSTKFANNLNGLKREIECDNMILDTWGEEPRNQPRMLSHHLSLPNTSADVVTMDKLLQFQDTVPCKLRAKRGFATHPRSIAERVRRTRISERMRKLQDLVPSMEKQTNTSDMLDFAVEYIKELQKQHKTLSDVSMKCKCSAMQKTV